MVMALKMAVEKHGSIKSATWSLVPWLKVRQLQHQEILPSELSSLSSGAPESPRYYQEGLIALPASHGSVSRLNSPIGKA